MEERDAFIDENFPRRECDEAPGCYSLPDGGGLGVFCNNRHRVPDRGGVMLSIAQEFLVINGGDTAAATRDFCEGLMAGDAEKCKAGYTAENAIIATAEAFDLAAVDAAVTALMDKYELDGAVRTIVRRAIREDSEAA